MKSTPRSAVFALFLLSGFSSLLYQVVWLRLAFASFGVITPVISVLVSVFMAGLYLGTWGAGRWIHRWTRASGLPPIAFYALAELVVGVGGLAVPLLFKLGERSLLESGASDSASYLLRSALLMGASVLPWCIAMGATVPVMLAQLRQERKGTDEDFSFLYLANVVGAMLGVLLTALLIVEALGLQGAGRFGASVNLALAFMASILAWRLRGNAAQGAEPPTAARGALGGLPRLAAVTLFLTGLLSMGMEVAWIRALTPVLQTQVYSFALVLFTYLLATFVGSFLYRRHAALRDTAPLSSLLVWCGLAALLPLLLNDPRLGLGVTTALISLFPVCLGLGYLTPMLVDQVSKGDPGRAGRAYALNILGSFLGPLLASYLLLPFLGVKASLLVLSAPFLALVLAALPAARRLPALLAGLLALALPLGFVKTFEDPVGYGPNAVVLRDHTATVVALGQDNGRRLLVNGIGITHVTAITKMMAHFPAAFRETAPRKGLVICFGMGTTFRSLASWGMDVTAVELVPSVKELFGHFFSDAARVMARPGNRIVIDDGRRYLMRSLERYDVITLDPPPPTEAAASSLLYSEEFYRLAKARLNDGGILQQWVPGAEPGTLRAMVGALTAVFPHVRMYSSHERWGFHFLASDRPLPQTDGRKLAARMPAAARQDLAEWIGAVPVEAVFVAVTQGEVDVPALLAAPGGKITDDRPFNEYYLMRLLFPGLAPYLN